MSIASLLIALVIVGAALMVLNRVDIDETMKFYIRLIIGVLMAIWVIKVLFAMSGNLSLP